jgi:hypothetical protein
MNNNAAISEVTGGIRFPLLGGEANDPLAKACRSHLRWDFPGRRPQHLMSRSARERHVRFVEKTVFSLTIHSTVPGADIRRRDYRLPIADCGFEDK